MPTNHIDYGKIYELLAHWIFPRRQTCGRKRNLSLKFFFFILFFGDCSNLLLPRNRVVDIIPLVDLARDLTHTRSHQTKKKYVNTLTADTWFHWVGAAFILQSKWKSRCIPLLRVKMHVSLVHVEYCMLLGSVINYQLSNCPTRMENYQMSSFHAEPFCKRGCNTKKNYTWWLKLWLYQVKSQEK